MMNMIHVVFGKDEEMYFPKDELIFIRRDAEVVIIELKEWKFTYKYDAELFGISIV